MADHFSRQAQEYARFRPRYPDRLFDSLASLAPRRELAWDCGTGNGQAARSLARAFRCVVASDASLDQLRHAPGHPRVRYAVAAAESTALPSASVDLVTVAQAVHWFDLDRFYAEVRRVCVPGGVIAVWCYQHTRIDPGVDRVVRDFYDRVVGRYWPPQIALVDDRYRGLPFPFEPVALGCAGIHAEATCRLAELEGYLASWSASAAYRRERGSDPLDQVRDALAAAWGDPACGRAVRWPLHVKVGRVTEPA